MSLTGLTVAITASRRAHELARLIENFGGVPYVAPTVGLDTSGEISASTEACNTVEAFLKSKMDYVVFMTGPGAFSLISASKKMGRGRELVEALSHSVVVARSAKPKAVLAQFGIKTDIVPDNNTAEGIAQVLKARGISGKRIAILWHGSQLPTLTESLKIEGAEVLEFSTYRYSQSLSKGGAEILKEMGFNYVSPSEAAVLKLIDDMRSGLVQAITFTSPPAVAGLFWIATTHSLEDLVRKMLDENIIVVAVGPSTRDALEKNGVRADVMPEVYKMGPMVKSLMSYLEQDGKNRKKGKKKEAE
jgi:uroporphyrinogen-III synthase